MSSLTENQVKGSNRVQILHQKSLVLLLLFHLSFLQNGDMTASVVFENILVLMGTFAVSNTKKNSLGFNIDFIIFSSIDQTLYWFSF